MYGHRTSILLTSDIYEKVGKTAKKLGSSNSDFIRHSIVKHLKEWEGI